MRKILREEDKLRSPRMSTYSKSKLTSKRQLMRSMLSNSPLRLTKLNLLEPRKSWKPREPELRRMRKDNRDSELKRWL